MRAPCVLRILETMPRQPAHAAAYEPVEGRGDLEEQSVPAAGAAAERPADAGQQQIEMRRVQLFAVGDDEEGALPQPHESEARIRAARESIAARTARLTSPLGAQEAGRAADGVEKEIEESSERAPLVGDDAGAESVGREAVPGEGQLELEQISEKTPRKKPRCLRCRRCCLKLREAKVRGFMLPDFVGKPLHSARAALLWGAINLALLTAVAAIFFTVEHVDNNYANKSMPIGGPGSGSGPDDPQYFDCHERTSGLYPAYLATALCVVLTPLYASLDPEYGLRRFRKKKWPEKNKEAEAKMRVEVIREEPEADVPLQEQAEALWKWAEGTADEDCKRWLSGKEITRMAYFGGMERGTLCELLGVVEREPIRGPRAVLGGRVGTVTKVGDDTRPHGKGEIQVRWQDDGTESPDVDENDAVKVLDLDEPLGEGSAVRHDGRRGTVATEPVDWGDGDNIWIQVRWDDDDGTASDEIKVSELEVEVRVGREAFVAACIQHPKRTAKMHTGLLYMYATVPHLKEKAEAAVLEAKIAAVWRWADTVADGELGPTELRRLADRAERRRYDQVCEALGLVAANEAVSISEEAFAAACRAKPEQTVLGDVVYRRGAWFATLQLDLVEERSCLADLCAACGC
eukprot:COSAG04_NODE_450_length_14158_cov_17.389573_4_plen_633_part_00